MGFFSVERKPCGCVGGKEVKKQRTDRVETWKGKDLEESVDVFIGMVPSWPRVRLLRAVREIDIEDSGLYKSIVKTTYLDYFCEECEDVFRIENSVSEEKDFDMDKIDRELGKDLREETDGQSKGEDADLNEEHETDSAGFNNTSSTDASGLSDETVKQKVLQN